jgi:hypothetical protein
MPSKELSRAAAHFCTRYFGSLGTAALTHLRSHHARGSFGAPGSLPPVSRCQLRRPYTSAVLRSAGFGAELVPAPVGSGATSHATSGGHATIDAASTALAGPGQSHVASSGDATQARSCDPPALAPNWCRRLFHSPVRSNGVLHRTSGEHQPDWCRRLLDDLPAY